MKTKELAMRHENGNFNAQENGAFLDRFGRNERTGIGGRERSDQDTAVGGTFGVTSHREHELLSELDTLRREHEAMTRILRELHSAGLRPSTWKPRTAPSDAVAARSFRWSVRRQYVRQQRRNERPLPSAAIGSWVQLGE